MYRQRYYIVHGLDIVKEKIVRLRRQLGDVVAKCYIDIQGRTGRKIEKFFKFWKSGKLIVAGIVNRMDLNKSMQTALSSNIILYRMQVHDKSDGVVGS